MLQRAKGDSVSKVRVMQMNKVTGKHINEMIGENINPLSTLHTDESPLYDRAGQTYKRETVIHILGGHPKPAICGHLKTGQ